MTIVPLYQVPELAQDVIALYFEEFGGFLGREFYESLVLHSMKKDCLPLTIAAMEDGELLGAVMAMRADMLCRQDLWPWLGCLAVRKERRRRGIGAALQEALADWCRGQGFPRLYLYTTLENYYEKTGWIYLEQGLELDGSDQKIYYLPLDEK